MKEYKYIPVLTANTKGRLLDEKELRALAEYLNDPNTPQLKRSKIDKKVFTRIIE